MDKQRIRKLIEILKSSSAGELSVTDGEQLIRLRRQPSGAIARENHPAAPEGSESQPIAPPGQQAKEPAIAVRANFVGLFYRGRGAESEPIVEIGDQVEENQVVGTIEALGRPTDVLSPASGEVVQILAEDGQPVEYGQVLIEIRPATGEKS